MGRGIHHRGHKGIYKKILFFVFSLCPLCLRGEFPLPFALLKEAVYGPADIRV